MYSEFSKQYQKDQAALFELRSLAKAIILEAGLNAGHNQPLHPRTWQKSGERWAAMAAEALENNRTFKAED